MVVHSPELLGNVAEVVQTSTDVVHEPRTLESVFFLLANLGCLDVLASSSENLKTQLDDSIRGKLQDSVGVMHLSKSLSLWTGFERFLRASAAQMSDCERDRVRVAFALTQSTPTQLFDPSMNWTVLQALGARQFEKLIVARGGAAVVESFVRVAYRRQRDALARELLLRALPMAVLWLAGLVAIAMALLFTRSLVSG